MKLKNELKTLILQRIVTFESFLLFETLIIVKKKLQFTVTLIRQNPSIRIWDTF